MTMVKLNEKAFTQYRRKQIAELRPWREGDDMAGISVSREDVRAGSPKPGDMIARNPKNHADQWLVAAAYFADNFEPASAIPAPDDGLVERLRYRVENPSAWDTFDQGGSDLIAEATTALQYKDERIERLSVQLEASALVAVELSSRLESAEQHVQKLTAENERLREALKVSRQVLAKLLSAGHNNPPATPEEIDAAFWSVDAALTQEGER